MNNIDIDKVIERTFKALTVVIYCFGVLVLVILVLAAGGQFK